MVTWQNYEEYMMMLVDGELSSHDEKELMAFVSQHPQLKSELAAFNMVKLEPATDIVFENKEKLMKSVSTKRVIALPVWQRYSIAAGVAAIIFISLFRLNKEDNTIASVVAPVSARTVAPAAPEQVKKMEKVEKAVEPAPVTSEFATNEVVKRPAFNNSGVAVKHRKTIVKQQMIASAKQESINEIALAGPMPIDNLPTATAALNEAPALALVGEVDQQEKGSFLKNLGIEEGKREGMEAVATAVTNTLNKVQSIKDNIDSRSLSVKIENKRLILSF
jgi:anti-sigma factor RsiW